MMTPRVGAMPTVPGLPDQRGTLKLQEAGRDAGTWRRVGAGRGARYTWRVGAERDARGRKRVGAGWDASIFVRPDDPITGFKGENSPPFPCGVH